MNIYHQTLPQRGSFLKHEPTGSTILTSSELSALLQLVIPSSDVLLPPIEMTLMNNYLKYDSIQHTSFGCMHHPSALPLPIFPHEDIVFHCGGADSPTLSKIVISAYNDEPLYDPATWIEPTPFLHRDGVVPEPDRVDAQELGTALEFLADAFQVPDKVEELPAKKSSLKCEIAGCNTKKQSNGRCIRHGGGRRCVVEGCTRGAQTMGRCKRHGGGARCKVDGCASSSQGGGLCRVHGGGKLCSAPGCKKGAQRQGKCATHSSRKCGIEDCSCVARSSGLCSRHKRQAKALAGDDQQTRTAKRAKRLKFSG